MRKRFTFYPNQRKGDGLFQGDRPWCILISGGSQGFKEEIGVVNLERIGIGQFGRDFGVPE